MTALHDNVKLVGCVAGAAAVPDPMAFSGVGCVFWRSNSWLQFYRMALVLF